MSHHVIETERGTMSTSTAKEPALASIAALLDRLDPAVAGRCEVPGCRHHHPDRADATRVGSALAA
jgi:hypothetical protein